MRTCIIRLLSFGRPFCSRNICFVRNTRTYCDHFINSISDQYSTSQKESLASWNTNRLGVSTSLDAFSIPDGQGS